MIFSRISICRSLATTLVLNTLPLGVFDVKWMVRLFVVSLFLGTQVQCVMAGFLPEERELEEQEPLVHEEYSLSPEQHEDSLYNIELKSDCIQHSEAFWFQQGSYRIMLENTGSYPVRYSLIRKGTVVCSAMVPRHEKRDMVVRLGDDCYTLMLSSQKCKRRCCGVMSTFEKGATAIARVYFGESQ